MPATEVGQHSQPTAQSANRIWTERVAAFAERPAFRFRAGGAWQTLTWAAADASAREIAAGLCSLGLAPGDRVAMPEAATVLSRFM